MADTEALAREIATNRMKIKPNCAARTVEADILPIVEISHRVGIALEAATFLGSSPIRTAGGRLERGSPGTHDGESGAVRGGARAAVDVRNRRHDADGRGHREAAVPLRDCSGARAIVLCDTAGHATPNGAYNLVKFAMEEVVKPSGEKIRVDWHGHNDRGLAVANSLGAIAAGADQVHAAANSLGERVGNTAMELMLVNLRLMGLISQDLSRLEGVLRESGEGDAHVDSGQIIR